MIIIPGNLFIHICNSFNDGVVLWQTYPWLCEQTASSGMADGSAKRNVPVTLQRL